MRTKTINTYEAPSMKESKLAAASSVLAASSFEGDAPGAQPQGVTSYSIGSTTGWF